MTTYYFLNIAGVKLSDEHLENIPFPRFELASHIKMRGIQLCSVVGGAMVGPAMAVYNGKTDRQGMLDSVWYHGERGFKAGCVMGGLLALKAMTLPSDGIKDRAYRLRCNRRQVFVDRISIGSTLVGVGAAYYLGEGLAKGAWFGFTGGCLTAGFINILGGYL